MARKKSKWRLAPIKLDSDHWLYESGKGLELHCGHDGGRPVGTIQINTIIAFMKRREAHREGGQ
jgi:hypothetical protein